MNSWQAVEFRIYHGEGHFGGRGWRHHCLAVFRRLPSSTLNFVSFSQVSFQFAVTPLLLAQGTALALLLGLFGGFLPALRAARLPIAAALPPLRRGVRQLQSQPFQVAC